jgi:CRISPR type I-E-associated protein CasB/Cse2
MSTSKYVEKLGQLKEGSLSLLRWEAGQGLDHSLTGSDLFTGLWWPLRQQSQFAPRRRVAWLVAKLHAVVPLAQQEKNTLPLQLGRIYRGLDDKKKPSFQQRFDALLSLPLEQLEPALQWALREISAANGPAAGLDWVQLIDDLSRWERENTRLQWARVFLGEAKQPTIPKESNHE